ncbi:MAG: hypothetical protein ABWY78_23815 [Microvirga sp.]
MLAAPGHRAEKWIRFGARNEAQDLDAVARRIEPFDDGATMLTPMMPKAMTSKTKTATTVAKAAD